MPLFKIRAQWWGPDSQTGVADDTVEAEDACAAVDLAIPGAWRTGQYTHATITIEPVDEK